MKNKLSKTYTVYYRTKKGDSKIISQMFCSDEETAYEFQKDKDVVYVTYKYQ